MLAADAFTSTLRLAGSVELGWRSCSPVLSCSSAVIFARVFAAAVRRAGAGAGGAAVESATLTRAARMSSILWRGGRVHRALSPYIYAKGFPAWGLSE